VFRRRSGAEPLRDRHVTASATVGSEPDESAVVPALVDRARSGDRTAFDDLVRLTYTDTYTLAFRLTGDEEDARDVVQETYMRAFRGLGRFRGDAQFTTWLYRITANCANTHLGRRIRHRHDELTDDDPLVDERPEVDPEHRAENELLRSRLREALQDLPPRLRAVVVLRDVYDLPHEAIAAELGISESAAKVRLHRARRKLREALYPDHRTPSESPERLGSAHAV
jgi:RNA polymerase sigma-70 factor, ECF subfamily